MQQAYPWQVLSHENPPRGWGKASDLIPTSLVRGLPLKLLLPLTQRLRVYV